MFRHYGYFTLQDDESRQQNSQFGAAPQRDPRPQDPVWTSPAQITFYFSVFYVCLCFEIDCMLSLKSLKGKDNLFILIIMTLNVS